MNALAKIAGWLAFGGQVASQVSTSSAPHGFMGWFGLLSSLGVAIGIHAASESAPAKP